MRVIFITGTTHETEQTISGPTNGCTSFFSICSGRASIKPGKRGRSKRGLISYVSATGAKSDTPIIETPLSVSVFTPERLDDIGAYTIQDAMGYVAGLYDGPYGVDTRGD